MVTQLSSVNKLANMFVYMCALLQYSNQKLSYNNHVNFCVHMEVVIGGKHVFYLIWSYIVLSRYWHKQTDIHVLHFKILYNPINLQDNKENHGRGVNLFPIYGHKKIIFDFIHSG